MDWSNLLTSDNNVLNVQKNYNAINSSDGGLSFLQGSDGATEVQRQLYIQASRYKYWYIFFIWKNGLGGAVSPFPGRPFGTPYRRKFDKL